MRQALEYLRVFDSPALNAALTFFIFIVAAKAVDLFVKRALKRITLSTKNEYDDRLLELFHKPVFYSVVLVGAIEAVSMLKPPEKVLYYLNGSVFTLLTLIWLVTGIRLSNLVLEGALRKRADTTGLGSEVLPFVKNILTLAVTGAGLMVLFSVWNVSITPLFASAGIAGAAIAFAAKDTIANFLGGISIFMDKPYKLGDYIVLDMGERGEVVEIGIRSTRIKTRDDILITIPNSLIANNKIINESAPLPRFRLRVPVSVAYGSDVEQVEEILIDIARKNENLVAEPAPRVRFRLMGESSLDFELQAWAKMPSLRGLTIHQLNKSIYSEFNRAGVKIPFPQRDVHIYRETEE